MLPIIATIYTTSKTVCAGKQLTRCWYSTSYYADPSNSSTYTFLNTSHHRQILNAPGALIVSLTNYVTNHSTLSPKQLPFLGYADANIISVYAILTDHRRWELGDISNTMNTDENY